MKKFIALLSVSILFLNVLMSQSNENYVKNRVYKSKATMGLGGSYDDYYQYVQPSEILMNGAGGGSGSITIQNGNEIVFYISAGWGSINGLRTGYITPINTTPSLPDMDLGEITTTDGTLLGRFAKIKDGQLYFDVVTVVSNPPLFCNYTVTKTIGGANDVVVNESITYYDGLGKPKQEIAIGKSPNQKDIIHHIEYDEFGRKAKEFLPYEHVAGTSGFYRIDAAESTKLYYKNSYPDDFVGIKGLSHVTSYSGKEFDNSPLHRVLKESLPGEEFKIGSGHEKKYEYRINTINEVKIFTVDSEGKLSGGTDYYLAGRLTKTIFKSEDWTSSDGNNHTSVEFKDHMGRLILTRNYNNLDILDTYYVYDDYGNLRYVLPPTLDTSELFQEVYSQSFYFTHSLFTQVSGGGGLHVHIVGDQLSVEFNAGFQSNSLPGPPQTINTLCSLPDIFIGYIPTTPDYGPGAPIMAYIESGKLKLFNPAGLSITAFNGTITTTLPSACVGGGDGIPITVMNQELVDKLAYQYNYDEWNRVVEKKLPGKSWEYTVYDTHDRPILTQDKNLRDLNKWSFIKYDVHGRSIYSGLYSSSKNRADLQIEVNNYIESNNPDNSENRVSFMQTVGPISLNYDNTAFPINAITEVLVVNYYDDYSFTDADKPATPMTVFGQTVTNRTNGLTTASWTKTLNQNSWTKSYTFYDEKARSIREYFKNHIGGSTIIDSELLFSGVLKKTITTHKKLATDIPILITDTYEYDHADRLKKLTQQVNNEAIEVITENTYDGIGKLIQKKVGGQSVSLQTVDYSYNVRGALTNINNVNINLGNSPDDDVFAFKLNYEGPNEGTASVSQQYSGLVSQSIWRSVITDEKQAYSYDFDPLNRLISAAYRKGSSLSNDAGKFELSGITYDKGGNIKTLLRNGSLGQIDNLSYTYDGNQLIDINDSSTSDGYHDAIITVDNNYNYDANGRMVKDLDKGITNIEYNHINLPEKIWFSNGYRIEILYDALGKKLEKKFVTVSGGVTKTLYINGFQYQDNQLQFFGHTEGYTYYESGSYKYAYIFSDHLGNNRLSYSDSNGDGSIASNEILSKTDYYPYGLIHSGEFLSGQGSNYKYKYQGKELVEENGLDQYDFGSRMYDPSIGRWFVGDPQAESFYGFSPYMGMGNNPTAMVDPDGEFVIWAMAIGGILNGIASHNSGGEFWKGFAVGAISGAVGAGVGNAIANSVGTFGFSSGFAAGFGGGFTGGFTSGLGNSLINGGDFLESLESGFSSGLKVGVTSGIIGGVWGGIRANKNDLDFWNGKDLSARALKFISQSGYEPTAAITVNDANLMKATNAWYPDAPLESTSKYTVENLSDNAKRLFDQSPSAGGATFPLKSSKTGILTGKSSVYFNGKVAFSSAQELYKTIGHELVHVSQIAALKGELASVTTNVKLFEDMMEFHAYKFRSNSSVTSFDRDYVRKFMGTYPEFYKKMSATTFEWTAKAKDFTNIFK